MSDFGNFLDGTDLLGGAQPTTGAPAGMSMSDWLDQPQQMTGVAREAALPASSFLSGLLSVFDAINPYAAINENDTWNNVAKKLGAVDRPDLQPQTTREKYEAAAMQGVGAALPMAPFAGGVAGLPTLLASGASGGAGSQLGGDIGESLGYPRLGAFLGGLLGTGAGGVVGGTGQRLYNLMSGNLGELGQAYRNAGVPLNFTPLDKASAYGSQAIGSAGRVRSLAEQEVNAFGQSAEDTAATLGTATTPQELGRTAQTAAQQWIDTFKLRNQALQERINDYVRPAGNVDLGPVRQTLGDISGTAGGNEAAESFLKSPLAKSIQSVVDTAPSDGLPWNTVRALRSRVGEYLENPAFIADAGTAQAKRLYGAFSDSLRGAAAQSPNPDAVGWFDLANGFTKDGHDFIEKSLTPLMSKDAPDAGQYLASSANHGDAVLGPLRQEIPQIADETGAYKLRDMVAATAGKQNAEGTAVSPNSFLTDWNKLSPEGKAALYTDPAARAKIDALATVSEEVRKRAALLNTSNTAHHNAIFGMGLAAMEGGKAGFEAGGIPGMIGGALTGGVAIPSFNYGVSLLGANRPLARLLAAQGPPSYLPTLLGGGASTAEGLLPPRPQNLLGYTPPP